MAKDGIDGFFLNCQLDEKFELIEAEFGLKGFAILIKLLQRIYGEHGYYCEYNSDISLLLAAKWNVASTGGDAVNPHKQLSGADNSSSGGRKNLIDHVVAASIRRGIFDKTMYEKYGILTSVGIQKRYKIATRKRVDVVWKNEYLLLNDVKNGKTDGRNKETDGRNKETDVHFEQSKVKESKINNNSFVATPAEPKQATVNFTEDSFEIKCVDILIDSCLKSFPNSKVPKTLLEKQKWAVEIDRMKRIDGRTESDIMQALNFAIKDSFWQTNIRSTKKFREKFETLFVQSKGKRGTKNNFNNFNQNQYDFDALEKELLSN